MLGESMGRSSGNQSRASARRRFSEPERKQNTPLLDDPSYWGDDDPPPPLRMADRFFEYVFGIFFGIVTMLVLAGSSVGGWFGKGCCAALVVMVFLLAHRLAVSNRLKRP